MNNLVQFNNHNIQIIERTNQLWLSSGDIALALGYEKTKSITNLYNNHKEEFDGMTEVIDSVTSNSMSRRQRIFNREGAWLIGMFARTPKAAEFRKWVLKVLGAVADNQLPAVPAPVDMKAIGGMVKKCTAVAVREELAKVKVVEYVNPIKNILSDDLLTENYMTPMEIETHIGHLLTGLWDYKKSSADMFKLYRLLEACKALACRYHSYANHLQGGVDFCEYYRGKNAKYFELNTDALYATVRGMLDTKIQLSAL